MKIKRLYKTDFSKITLLLSEEKLYKSEANKIIRKYFDKEYIGYGYFNSKNKLLGYCFIKNPNEKPETTTHVFSKYRNKGIATTLRNYAINDRKFQGNLIWSATQYDNFSSLKSLLKSGFQVFDITKDKYIQLVKVINYI